MAQTASSSGKVNATFAARPSPLPWLFAGATIRTSSLPYDPHYFPYRDGIIHHLSRIIPKCGGECKYPKALPGKGILDALADKEDTGKHWENAKKERVDAGILLTEAISTVPPFINDETFVERNG